MPFLSSLPENTDLADVLKRFPDSVKPLLEYHDVILRGPSPLSIAQRELIAAFVSGLNQCDFCYGAHSSYAESFGIEPEVLDGLFSDFDGAAIDDKMRPVLAYAKKLTLTPAKIVKRDVDAILEAGWEDQAVHDAAAVTALFNLMNRIIFGLGVEPHGDIFAMRKEDARQKSIEERRAANEKDVNPNHYCDYGRMLGIIKD